VTTWVALLRGINVGGHKKVLMADLRALCTSLGFGSVATYIQSGNVVFRAREADSTRVASKLQKGIAATFGFDVDVVVRDVAGLEAAVDGNPFLAEGVEDTSKLHFTFLAEVPAKAARAEFGSYRMGVDELRLVGREAYLHCPQGLGKTKFTPTFIERRLGTAATTRNWRTVTTLLEMARGL
jgi:uncharacterized protein (DUF1697 family)